MSKAFRAMPMRAETFYRAEFTLEFGNRVLGKVPTIVDPDMVIPIKKHTIPPLSYRTACRMFETPGQVVVYMSNEYRIPSGAVMSDLVVRKYKLAVPVEPKQGEVLVDNGSLDTVEIDLSLDSPEEILEKIMDVSPAADIDFGALAVPDVEHEMAVCTCGSGLPMWTCPECKHLSCFKCRDLPYVCPHCMGIDEH
jgi:hypothetical protein